MKKIQTVLTGDDFTQWHSLYGELCNVEKVVQTALLNLDVSPNICRVAHFDRDQITLNATSSSATTLLRQILPTLQAELKENGIKVGRIEVFNR